MTSLLTVYVVLQVIFVLHVIKTGRNVSWLYIIVLLPVAGSLAYLIMVIIPEIVGHDSMHLRPIGSTLPDCGLSQAASDYFLADTVENAKNLAAECLKKDLYAEAKHLYKTCLKGIYEHDPSFMFGLAQCEYGLGQYACCRSVLDDLIQHNPKYKNAEAHLLYAKTLERLQETKSAVEEYEVLVSYYWGPEPSYRLAMLLKRLGQEQRATQILKKILSRAHISGSHYYRLHKNWILLAKNAL